MERARSTRGPLSILFIEVDRFNQIVDYFGHDAADDVLELVARRVQGLSEHADTLVRRGGHEFVLVMPDTGGPPAFERAVKARDELAQVGVCMGSGEEIRQTLSIGVATWDGREDPEKLTARAEDAAFESKRRGGGQVTRAPMPGAEPA